MVLSLSVSLKRFQVERSLAKLLRRETELAALQHLIEAMDKKISLDLTGAAIGFDANVFLTLATYKGGEEVIDYLAAKHEAPLILPGQVLQEFWNNQLNAVDTLYSGIKKKIDPLRKEVSKIDKADLQYLTQAEEALDKFGEQYEALYGASTRHAVTKWLSVLKSKSYVPFVSRYKFSNIARHREATKTPPGFKDDGDGDFYVWADFLYGLATAKAEKQHFSRSVLVTGDRKIDWVRNGVTHPILAAEASAFTGVPFEIWTTAELVDAVARADL